MAAFFNSNFGRPKTASDNNMSPKRSPPRPGNRLSVIMENNTEHKPHARKFPNGSGFLGHARQGKDAKAGVGSGYLYNTYSEKQMLPPPNPSRWQRFKEDNFFMRKGGWKRLILVAGILLLVIVAIVVGVTVGLRDKSDNSTDDTTNSGGGSASGVGVVGATSTASGSSPTSTAVPDNFPVGTYSLVTFLDTVGTECTSDPNTWTCFPYVTYSQSSTRSQTTFNWIISEMPEGQYHISSVSNPFAISFANTNLVLQDEGAATERYTFQIEMTKVVVPTTNITSDGVSAQCFYNATTLTGNLYTKMAKEYPTAAESSGTTAYQVWPYAVRIDQAATGGTNVPNCYQTINGELGAQIGDFTAAASTASCDCLYANYLPAS